MRNYFQLTVRWLGATHHRGIRLKVIFRDFKYNKIYDIDHDLNDIDNEIKAVTAFINHIGPRNDTEFVLTGIKTNDINGNSIYLIDEVY